MRILVAGATGYVGSRLVPELVRRGHRVVAAFSSPGRPHRPGVGPACVLERSVTATGLPGATLLASALHVAEHRVRGLLGLVS